MRPKKVRHEHIKDVIIRALVLGGYNILNTWFNVLNYIKKIFSNNPPQDKPSLGPVRTPSVTIQQRKISKNAIKVINRLQEAGYCGYLVGGSVRDLLLQRQPKDFDIATDATPEEIHHLFRNCRIIGRRFRLAHIYFRNEILEVATFRAKRDKKHPKRNISENGLIISDNVFGDIEEDASRRDFTVNALFYDIKQQKLIDYTNGLGDLEQHQLRLIGDPKTRYQEDPVRMLRAVRFAGKLGFTIETETAKPISNLSKLLADISSSRLYQEITKLLLEGSALNSFELLKQYNLLKPLFPALTQQLQQNTKSNQIDIFLNALLRNTDERVHAKQPVIPAFIFSGLLWPAVNHLRHETPADTPYISLEYAVGKIIGQQQRSIALPKNCVARMREIWMLQYHLELRRPRKVFRTLNNPRFRAGCDFLLLRAEADSSLSELANWWQQLRHAKRAERNRMVEALQKQRQSNKKMS